MNDSGSKSDNLCDRRTSLGILGTLLTGGCLRMGQEDLRTHTDTQTSIAPSGRDSSGNSQDSGTSTVATETALTSSPPRDTATSASSPQDASTTTGEATTSPMQKSTETATPPPIELIQRWKVPIELTGWPVVAGETIYAATGNRVTAIGPDGTRKWTTPLEQEQEEPDGFAYRFHGGFLYVTTLHITGDNPTGSIYKLRGTDGTVESSQEIGPISSPPAVTNDHVVVGTDYFNKRSTNTLLGLSTDGLTEQWRVSESDIEYRGGVGHAGLAFVGFGGSGTSRFEARNPDSGDVVWDVQGLLGSAPVVYDDAIVAHFGNEVHRYHPDDGDRRWGFHLSYPDDHTYLFYGAPRFESGTGFFGFFHTVLAFDPSTGQAEWSGTIEGVIDHPPTLAGGIVWVAPETPTGDSKTTIIGFDSERGGMVFERTFDTETKPPLAINGDLVIVQQSSIAAYRIVRG